MIRTLILEDGKYTFVYDDEKYHLTCLRYGEPWRDFLGDKAVMALFDAAVSAKEEKGNDS